MIDDSKLDAPERAARAAFDGDSWAAVCFDEADAKHIAEADPPTVLALVEEVWRLRAAVDLDEVVKKAKEVQESLSGNLKEVCALKKDEALDGEPVPEEEEGDE